MLYKQGKFLLCAILLCIGTLDSFAQDIQQAWKDAKAIKDAKPLSYTGGFNASSVFYGVNGIKSRRAPMAYALNANVNISIFKQINIPLSINYTDNGLAYSAQNPLEAIWLGIINRTGISPKYKWVTLHLGDRSMDFTRYSYSGVRFFGVGLELAPEKSYVKWAGFYGRLVKRTLADSINGAFVAPAYERMAWGTKVDIGKGKHLLSLIAFKARDEYFPGDILSTRFGLSPQENVVFAAKTKNQITDKLDIQLEFNTSAYSGDIRNLKFENTGNFNYFNNMGGLFSPVLSTRFNNAYNIGANYKEKFFTLGLNYLRVDPTYQSLGTLTAKNDIEAYTLNATTNIWQNKINISATGGLEQNNLAQNLKLTMQRFIGSANITYNIIKDLSLNLNYSNFNHSTSPSVITKVDSVKLVQINQSRGAIVNYSFGKTSWKHSTMFSATFQDAKDIRELVNTQILVSNDVTNFLASYSINQLDWQTIGTLAMNYNQIKAPGVETVSFGPSINVSKKMLDKKLVLNYTFTFLNNQDIGAKASILNNKLSGNYKLNTHHTIKSECSIINRNTIEGKGQSFTEFQGKIAYDYTF